MGIAIAFGKKGETARLPCGQTGTKWVAGQNSSACCQPAALWPDSGKKTADTKLNFSGNSNELIYIGGEMQFIENMIRESKLFYENVKWFTTLVSKETYLKKISKLLNTANVAEKRTIEMGTGNKSTRIVAWTFLSRKEKKAGSK